MTSQCPKREDQLAARFRLIGNQVVRKAAFIVCKYMPSYGTAALALLTIRPGNLQVSSGQQLQNSGPHMRA